MKNILNYNFKKARVFFLKEESYFSFELPPYFTFQKLINKVSKRIDGKELKSFYSTIVKPPKTYPDSPRNYDDVNYKFLNNKDGKFAWRPFQIIHPALYVSLVHEITTKDNWGFIVKRFKEFDKNPKIKCLGLPNQSKGSYSDKAVAISNWWKQIEQKSIQLALNYEYIMHSDISDCYGSIYTHSIAWALHEKDVAKANREDPSLVGNVIDRHLQDMAFGQTNGIPQGSALMDFIAEMVLGYADLELSKQLSIKGISDYQILRYRDDYRVFTNNPQEAELILKCITEILIDLGMRLNAQKTIVSNNVIQDSIKADKHFWISNKRRPFRFQENLLVIHSLALKYPNSGSLTKELTSYFNKIKFIKNSNENIPVLISIVIDIAYKNPKTYPIIAAILSKLLSQLKTTDDKKQTLEQIINRFKKIPNTGHLQIWLQRISVKIDGTIPYDEKLCEKIPNAKAVIWNSKWLSKKLRNLIDDSAIIDRKFLKEMDEVISKEEVELFESKTDYGY